MQKIHHTVTTIYTRKKMPEKMPPSANKYDVLCMRRISPCVQGRTGTAQKRDLAIPFANKTHGKIPIVIPNRFNEQCHKWSHYRFWKSFQKDGTFNTNARIISRTIGLSDIIWQLAHRSRQPEAQPTKMPQRMLWELYRLCPRTGFLGSDRSAGYRAW